MMSMTLTFDKVTSCTVSVITRFEINDGFPVGAGAFWEDDDLWPFASGLSAMMYLLDRVVA